MSPTAQKIVDDLIKAAMNYGWHSDQGSAKTALKTQKELVIQTERLDGYITAMQNANKHLRKKVQKYE